MTASFFEQIAEAQTPAPVKRKLDAAEKRRSAAKQAEQDLKDQQVLSKLYRQWKEKKRHALLSGPHGKEVRGLVTFIDAMTLSSAPALIRLVQDGASWIGTMSRDERADLLGIIGIGIARCREKAGLPSFDDALIDEPDKAFHQIKSAMGCW